MKLLTYSTTKIKVISSSCLLIALSGCGSSFSDVASPTGGQISGRIRPQAVVISRISTIPTNLGVSGSHTIKVDNHTGKNLTLKSFELSGSATSNIFTKGYSALKSAVGAIGYDSRINVVACGSLFADSSCTITFSPNEADGSAALRLNFVDDSGNLYPAAQLLEYSSAVNKQNGFYVSNAQIADVPSTDSYSIAIPFVSDDNYESIVIDSRIITLSKSVDCANGASKGAHCTALLTLPAADPASGGYSNTIKIKGTKADGSINYASLASGTNYNDIANLAITSGPVIIKAKDSTPGHLSLTKTINIVNNGVNEATNVSDLSVIADKWIAGVTTSGGASLLAKTITCGASTVISLPTSLAVADICQVEFTLTNPEATGSEDYKITYSGGVDGAKSTTTSTKIYYMGLDIPDYRYILTGTTDFIGVKVGASVSSSFLVENVGSKALQDISYPSSPALPAGLTVDAKTSSCSNYTGSTQLMPGDFCTYSLKYAPQSVAAENLFTFTVLAKTTAEPSTEVTPSQSRSVMYSATNGSGNGFVISNNSKGYLIFADGKDSRTSRVLIQNTGTNNFNLSKITANGWSTSLSLFGPDDATTNSLAGLSSTDGTVATPWTIEAGAIAALDYTYGPTSTLESGVAQQNFVGKFAGDTTDYSVVNITGYKAVDNGVVVTSEPVTSGITDGISGVDNKFVLIRKNQATVKFKYAAGKQAITGFLVNDSNLPFGFMVNTADTTCPTASKNDNASDIAANASCLVSYTYLASELNHSLFYTAAVTPGLKDISAPSYSIKDATGIHVVTPVNTKINLNPIPFVNVDAAATIDKNNNKLHTITFTASGYADKLLPGAQVIVKPTFVTGVTPRNVSSCTITSPANNGTCSIEVTKDVPDAVNIPFNYSSTVDGGFNSRNSGITLSN